MISLDVFDNLKIFFSADTFYLCFNSSTRIICNTDFEELYDQLILAKIPERQQEYFNTYNTTDLLSVLPYPGNRYKRLGFPSEDLAL